jgi:hypothetical protein
MPGFVGAYTAGSVNDLPDDAPLPPASDVDVMVVIDETVAPPKPGKFSFRNVLLEVTYLTLEDVRIPELVLSHYHLAAGLQSAHVLADRTGHITALQSSVATSFADPYWVRLRCEMARDTVLARLDALETAETLHGQVMSWLFAAGGVPHILLVAGMRNPTVRKRYEAVYELLQHYGFAELYPDLLAQFGARDVTVERVTHHLDALEATFDTASKTVKSPFPFESDISADARGVAIDGSRELIRRGRHREAMFWIAVTFTRCQMVLHADAPAEIATRRDQQYAALLADLGVGSSSEIQRSAYRIRESLSPVWEVSEHICRTAAGNGGGR